MLSRLLLLIALLAAPTGAALAHAQLRAASPAVGATVTTTPTEIAITFSEGVEPKFSSIEVRDDSGARIDNADPHNGSEGQTKLIVSLLPLRPGVYTVRWQVLSVDTHRTTGSYRFTLSAP